ncbi:NADPH-dependent 2,4-dienoyl-CoA reductase [Novosphingobium sp. LASN5T]|uniref:NADPH-dependent 2,4-dienoyl-CoA reductase n=1 Tax=Novosphingobium sp. LASN5T TaxID=2491021 RepID=UPI000F5D5D99|nr:NADPH-dependent 2,4-dienoyl-CoA reductase [Novosphingobium sp. LASN5T]RQW45883.1 NADPH-dependent 2,4-dienoyl-CoA reductase [Novosphingobium sp. LASN5T]
MNAPVRYPHVFSELAIGPHRLKNRIIMGSMHTGLEDVPDAAERLAAYFVDRVKGGVGTIITGGIAPHVTGGVGAKLSEPSEVPLHRHVTDAVHAADPDVKICMQILHTGPLAHTPDCVAPSPVKSRIGAYVPRELDDAGIEEMIAAFANCAKLAREAGYDGAEIIGSAGYLISTFLVEKTNQRTDRWGGSWENRMRFPLEVVRRVRVAVGPDFLLIFRISAMDMLQGGLAWDEVVSLAKALEAEGVDVISTHFCWHESFVPTIATMVPRAAFTQVTGRLRKELSIPLITSNRINMPDVAEAVLARGDADLVSMARPMLADPDLVNKAREGREDEINTCIGCNQACLDHTFTRQLTSCLVNARACRETEIVMRPAQPRKRIAVVGAGPAGLAFSTLAAERGHDVTLFDAADEIGGQFNLAKRIPGKEEFHETLRYFRRMIDVHGVTLKLGTRVDAAMLADGGFDEIVIATGIAPRRPDLHGIDHPKAVRYIDVIAGAAQVGRKVAIMGAGGIGFDVAELITHQGTSAALDIDVFAREWGIDFRNHPRGGVTGVEPAVARNDREVTLMQRKATTVGKGLGRTTGWTHRLTLQRRGVRMVGGVEYLRIDDAGLHTLVEGQPVLFDVDTVIVCAGQEPARGLHDDLAAAGIRSHLVGGACEAAELDAKRAIRQATELAMEV